MACYRIFLSTLSHALKWDQCPLSGRWLHQEDSTNPVFHRREDTNDEHLENAHLAPPHLRWGRDALQPPEIQRARLNRNTCVHIHDDGFRCVIWNTRGLIGSPTSPQLSRERIHNYFTRLAKNNDIICLQEIHGKHEFPQAIQVLAPQFRLYGTFIPKILNAGGSAICTHKNLLSEGAIITHAVTCQGRDRIVNIQSGARNLVVVNVHF